MTTTALREIDVARPCRKWPRFSRHKPAGMAWIHEVPEHWRIEKLEHVAAVRFSSVNKKTEEGEIPVRLCNYTDVYNRDLISDDIDFMQATATAAEIERFTLKRGDVLITKDSEEWDDIAVPAYVAEDISGVLCGYHLALIRPYSTEIDGAFLSRAFTADGIRQQFHIAANGITRFGLPNRAIAGALFPVPPLDEQRAIAGFLDRETARIDELIAKKRRLIELLREKRQALISRAVTKGLDPNVPMKPSGIDWVGEVPEDWELKRLKYIAAIRAGENITALAFDEGGEYPVYGGNGIRGCTSYYTHDGDFVLIGRQGALCGNVHRVRGKFWASEHAAVATCREGVHVDWFAHLVETMDLKRYSETAAQPGLALERVVRLRIPFPDTATQREIAAFVDGESAKIDKLAKRIEEGVFRLLDYRTALITAAVTGQIDVRNYREEAPCP